MKKEVYTQGCRPKGKVGDYVKVTFTEEIGKIKKAIPAPGKYKDLENWKKSCGKRPKGTYNPKETIYTMIDECHFLSKKIPASNKYKIHNLEVTKPRIFQASFNDKEEGRIGERMKKIDKG